MNKTTKEILDEEVEYNKNKFKRTLKRVGELAYAGGWGSACLIVLTTLGYYNTEVPVGVIIDVYISLVIFGLYIRYGDRIRKMDDRRIRTYINRLLLLTIAFIGYSIYMITNVVKYELGAVSGFLALIIRIIWIVMTISIIIASFQMRRASNKRFIDELGYKTYNSITDNDILYIVLFSIPLLVLFLQRI